MKFLSLAIVSFLCLPLHFASANSDSLNSPTMEASFEGFVTIEDERELYVRYIKPHEGRPLVVLLNGLTYSTRQWDLLINELETRGLGVLAYDMAGQGRTLLRYAPVVQPIDYRNQVQDLKSLFRALKVQVPVHLVGLSYGGGIALAYTEAFPKDVENTILLAPYTEPLESQDAWIKSQIWATRTIFPYNRYTDDELYDYFLQQIVYATYPQLEPIVLENPFKLEATFRLVQGIRKYSPVESVSSMKKGKLHLVVALQDQYIQQNVMERFWSQVPNSIKASRIFFHNSEHKIPEVVPMFTAKWIDLITSGDSEFSKGTDFEGFPFRDEYRKK